MNRFRYIISTAALLSCVQLAVAQQPPDSTKPRPDTSQTAKVFADSVRPVDQLAAHYDGAANGFSDGVWYWDRTAFLNQASITLAELLESLPSVLGVRTGLYLQPHPVAPFGGTANRVEVYLDGYALDPLLESSVDFSKLELANIESVRIDRRLGVIRIDIQTLTAKDTRSYSMVEAAVGQPRANLFRGVFLAPKLLIGPAGLALDRIDTNGNLGGEPANQSAGSFKWAFVRKGSGLQFEYRRVVTDRDPTVPWAQKYDRTDMIVRLRTHVRGLVLEAFGGRSIADIDTATTKNDSIPKIAEKNTQFGGRASFDSPLFWANGSYRSRDVEALPATQIEGSAGLRHKYGAVSGSATSTDWRSSGTATDLTVRGEVGPAAFRVFGEMTTSDRGAPYLSGRPDTAIITSYSGYRAGAAVNWHGITAGGALVHIESDSVTTFGMPFDRTRKLYAGPNADGVEATGRIPLFIVKGFYAIGTVTDWRSGEVSLYMPTRMYRAGLEWSSVLLKSGNLEIHGRIENIYRGAMRAPNFATGIGVDQFVIMPATSSYDAYLQIRIIDLRAFMRYEDLTSQIVSNFPGRVVRGPRIIYGVKWQFFN